MNEQLESLVAAAIRAPSGDNTQPWRFLLDPARDEIVIQIDETRDPSPMNSGQRMARIGAGAAVENLLRAAQYRGWTADLVELGTHTSAVVRFHPSAGHEEKADAVVRDRVTNRRPYDGRPVPADILDRLRSKTPALDGVVTYWIVDRGRLTELASLLGETDATMFGEPSMRKAFLANVRFDAPADAAVEEGLSLNSLELTAGDRLALRLMPRLPQWLLAATGGLRVFASKARQLVNSSSGLCVIVAPDSSPRTDWAIGRAMQRAWLALTEEGLATQPMMSLPVLENARENGSAELVASLGADRLAALSARFRELVPEVGGGRPGFLLRLGYAPPPSGRTGRLPLSRVVHLTSPEAQRHVPTV